MSARVAEPAADPRRHVVQFYDRQDELAASVGVAVTRSADTVRISVRDGSPDAPLAPSRGHGLVAAVARRWASDPLADGKIVWAEMR